ncbi:unnamed protein product, partial [Brassica rapa subsp. trilocularis]
ALFIFVSVQIRFLLEPNILLDLHVGSVSLLALLWYRFSSFSDLRVRLNPELTGVLPVFNPKDPIEIYSLSCFNLAFPSVLLRRRLTVQDLCPE